jgi:hypothetical protein
MKAEHSSEMLEKFYQTTQHHIPSFILGHNRLIYMKGKASIVSAKVTLKKRTK